MQQPFFVLVGCRRFMSIKCEVCHPFVWLAGDMDWLALMVLTDLFTVGNGIGLGKGIGGWLVTPGPGDVHWMADGTGWLLGGSFCSPVVIPSGMPLLAGKKIGLDVICLGMDLVRDEEGGVWLPSLPHHFPFRWAQTNKQTICLQWVQTSTPKSSGWRRWKGEGRVLLLQERWDNVCEG